MIMLCMHTPSLCHPVTTGGSVSIVHSRVNSMMPHSSDTAHFLIIRYLRSQHPNPPVPLVPPSSNAPEPLVPPSSNTDHTSYKHQPYINQYQLSYRHTHRHGFHTDHMPLLLLPLYTALDQRSKKDAERREMWVWRTDAHTTH